MRIVGICSACYIAYCRKLCYDDAEVIEMILKRKIYDKFLEWKNETNGKKALLVEGARRIGKSTIASADVISSILKTSV